MSQNANQKPTPPTPEQALDILRQVAGLEQLKLSLGEHAAVQQALQVVADALKPADKQPAGEAEPLKVV